MWLDRTIAKKNLSNNIFMIAESVIVTGIIFLTFCVAHIENKILAPIVCVKNQGFQIG